MKTSLRLFFVSALLVGSAAGSLAQVSTPPPSISVSGSAEIKVAPDEAVLSIGIETRDASLLVAQKENDERATRALKFLRDQGVADADIRTDYVHIEADYEWGKARFNVEGYHVRKGMEVRIRKLENFEALLSGLLGHGVNRVGGVNFRTSELRRHRDQARQLAVRAAREKADALAAELGARRGKVHQISEYSAGGYWSGMGSWWGNYSASNQNVSYAAPASVGEMGEGSVSLGQISVSANVQVTFLLE